MRKIKAGLLVTVAGILFCWLLVSVAKQGRPILDKIGVTRGICVVLGDRRCELALEMAPEQRAADICPVATQGGCGIGM